MSATLTGTFREERFSLEGGMYEGVTMCRLCEQEDEGRYPEALVDLALEELRNNPEAYVGLDGPGEPTADDAEQLLDSGWRPEVPNQGPEGDPYETNPAHIESTFEEDGIPF